MASLRSDLSTKRIVVLTSNRSISFLAASCPSFFKMKVTTSAKTMSEITATARRPSISVPNALARSCCASRSRAAAIQKFESTKTSLPTINLLVEVLGRVARWTSLHQTDDRRKIQWRGESCSTSEFGNIPESRLDVGISKLWLMRLKNGSDKVVGDRLILKGIQGRDGRKV